MAAVPEPTALARPLASIVATDLSDDAHVPPGVTSTVYPSAVFPVAVNCSVSPTCSVGFAGETVIDVTVLPETKKFPHPDALIRTSSIAPTAEGFRKDKYRGIAASATFTAT